MDPFRATINSFFLTIGDPLPSPPIQHPHHAAPRFETPGAQARKNESPETRGHSGGGHPGTDEGVPAGALSRLSEDPSLAYLHALAAVAIGSLVSCGDGGDGLASGALAGGLRKHVSLLSGRLSICRAWKIVLSSLICTGEADPRPPAPRPSAERVPLLSSSWCSF